MPTVATPQTATDPDFFFSIVQFQVEGVLFGLPSYVFEPSKVLQAKITSQQPCVLEDVTAGEFRDFLACLIAPLPPSQASMQRDEAYDPDGQWQIRYMRRWVHALKLATRWGFDELRWTATGKIDSMDDPPLKLAVGRAHDMPWLLPAALRDLADTKVMTPLNKEDYEILGFELAIQVAQFRERCNCNGRDKTENEADYCRKLVEEIFGAEFAKDVLKGESQGNPRHGVCLTLPSPGRRRAQRGERQ